MKVWVFAGGDKVARISRKLPAPPDYAIAADSGLLIAQAHEVDVDLLVGDLDSAPAEAIARAGATDIARVGATDIARAGAQVRRYDTDKDATDLELAFQAALEQNPTSITLIGGYGGRPDHFLANVDLLAALPAGIRATAQMGSAIVHVVRDEVTLEGSAGQYVSLIPWGGEVEGVLTRGLRWGLDRETLKPGSSRGVSNELAGNQAMVGVKSGTLLVIHEQEDLLD